MDNVSAYTQPFLVNVSAGYDPTIKMLSPINDISAYESEDEILNEFALGCP